MKRPNEGVCWVRRPWKIRGGGTARVSPSGLLVEPPGQETECWEWTDLEFKNNQWVCQQGDRKHAIRAPQNRRLWLLQLIAVRQLCRGGGWRVSDPLSSQAGKMIDGAFACLGVIVGSGWALWFLISFLAMLHREHVRGYDGVVMALGALAVLVLAWALRTMAFFLWMWRASRASRLNLSRDVVEVVLPNGMTTFADWRNVRLESGLFRTLMLCVNGVNIPLGLLRRSTRIALEVRIGSIAHRRQRWRMSKARGTFLVIGLGLLAFGAIVLCQWLVAPLSGVPSVFHRERTLTLVIAFLVVGASAYLRWAWFRDRFMVVRRFRETRRELGRVAPPPATSSQVPTLAPL